MINSSSNLEKDNPETCQNLGYMEIGVKPDRVSISLR